MTNLQSDIYIICTMVLQNTVAKYRYLETEIVSIPRIYRQELKL